MDDKLLFCFLLLTVAVTLILVSLDSHLYEVLCRTDLGFQLSGQRVYAFSMLINTKMFSEIIEALHSSQQHVSLLKLVLSGVLFCFLKCHESDL